MERIYKSIYYFLIFFISSAFFNFAYSAAKSNSITQEWLEQYTPVFIDRVIDNVSPSDGKAGAIIAAKSKSSPNYYFHWVRDAALSIDALIQIYPRIPDIYKKNKIKRAVFDYLDFSSSIQQKVAGGDLGEPKFYVDGSVFTGDWGRPQTDGPALRAISLIHFANLLLTEGNEELVREKLYNGRLPATSPIKIDLEYVSHHWRDPSYDLWEEVKGTHFYTLMVQRRALIEGATLAKRLGDTGAASWYMAQSRLIEAELEKFYDDKNDHFVPTINRVAGVDYKHSNLDSSILLGLMHGGLNDGFLPWNDKQVLATLEKLVAAFADLYPINHVGSIPGVAIGRYPEDKYAGTHFNGGNPWVLCTLAVAESLYNYSTILRQQGLIDAANKVAARADQFVERVRYHGHKDGTLDEQINRDTGYMTSASDLTWNYAALLTTRNALV